MLTVLSKWTHQSESDYFIVLFASLLGI